MGYEYEHDILELLKDIERERSLDLSKEIDEIQGTYQTARLIDNIVTTTKKRLTEQECKAKAFDEIREFITKKLKEEEEEQPRTLLSDYDFGLYQAYDNVDDIMQEHMERADDEY